MSNLESQNLPTLETQISNELTTDDLEQVSGGFPPLLLIGASIAGRYIAKKVISGIVRGAVQEEIAERNHARQGC